MVKLFFLLPLVASLELSLNLLALENIDFQFHELSERVQSNPCIHDALQEFIEQCTVGGSDSVDANLRKMLAVKLSVCEFQEAEVDYPENCKYLNSQSDYGACVQQLRETAQFWTTYSGNYRKLRSICYEEALPFVKERIVDLFHNVTRIYSTFYDSARKAAQDSKAFQDDIELRFYQLLDLVNLAILVKYKQEEKMKDDFEDFRKVLVSDQQVLKEYLNSFWAEIGLKTESMVSLLGVLHRGLALTLREVDQEYGLMANKRERFSEDYDVLFSSVLASLDRIHSVSSRNDALGVSLKDSLISNLQTSNDLGASLHTASSELDIHILHVDNSLSKLFETGARAFENQIFHSVLVVESTLATLSNRALNVRQQMDEQFRNFTTAMEGMQTDVTSLAENLSLLSKINIFGSLSWMLSHSLVLLKWVPMLILVIFASTTLMSKTLKKAVSFVFAMIPGFFMAYLLHFLLQTGQVSYMKSYLWVQNTNAR